MDVANFFNYVFLYAVWKLTKYYTCQEDVVLGLVLIYFFQFVPYCLGKDCIKHLISEAIHFISVHSPLICTPTLKDTLSSIIIFLLKNYSLYQKLLNALSTGRKEMVYLTTHSAHFIYGYMASDIW